MASPAAFAPARNTTFWSLCTVLLGACCCACQSYPFEVRLAERSAGRQLDQDVATLVPADILFVIDNSGSMLTQRRELIANLGQFIEQMSASTNDFHLGIITTDVECNLPTRDCAATPINVSSACCELVQAGNLPICQDVDINGDGLVDWSSCDAGRLRAPRGSPAYFSRPAGDPNAWIAAVSDTLLNLGCNGSGYESGLEAMRRAVTCAQGSTACPSQAIAELNAGFLRAEADLVVVFVTDEDDCSYTDPNVYLQPADPSQKAQQANHLCSPAECYAYYGQHLDANGDGLQNWADPTFYALDGATPPLTCGTPFSPVVRVVNPPQPSAVQPYLDVLVAAKGGDISRVRAAGIVSSVANSNMPLGFAADVCVNLGVGVHNPDGLGVTDVCGCWSASVVSDLIGTQNLYCALTDLLVGQSQPLPVNASSNECSSVGTGATVPDAAQPGCKAMPSGRYVDFLQRLSAARQSAGYASKTLLDTVCNASYSDTMFDIVNTVILNDCFDLGVAPASAQHIDMRLGGKQVPAVAVGSTIPGFSWQPGSTQVCLEGGLHKTLGDTFSIFVLQSS